MKTEFDVYGFDLLSYLELKNSYEEEVSFRG